MGRFSISVVLLLFVLTSVLMSDETVHRNLQAIRVYKNSDSGFSLYYPSNLVENTSSLRKNIKAQNEARRAVVFSAFEMPLPSRARRGFMILAEDATRGQKLPGGQTGGSLFSTKNS